MNVFLLDIYRVHDKLFAWVKENGSDKTIELAHVSKVYVVPTKQTRKLLPKAPLVKKEYYDGTIKTVLEISISRLSRYEKIIRWLELSTQFQAELFNADISPEQEYLYTHNITPCSFVKLENNELYSTRLKKKIRLSSLRIELETEEDIRKNFTTKLTGVLLDENGFRGSEKAVLKKMVEVLQEHDPDIFILDRSHLKLPYLYAKLKHHNMCYSFHRFHEQAINYKGGKSFFSYGRVSFKDFPVRLHGRFLVDSSAVVAQECDDQGIMELCELSGSRFQTIASRSFGSVFQAALLKEMYRRDVLIPYKQKPVDRPLDLQQLIKADRVGLVLDPEIGLHTDVAEIDFSSMFPHIIYEHNVSAETIGTQGTPVPGLPFAVSSKKKGIVPAAVYPLIKRRMEHKNKDSTQRIVQGLKWVLVTSYGYLRFREFKLGTASSHMVIGAYARELLLQAIGIAEDEGFEVIHGIVDALYIKKKNITQEQVDSLCERITRETKIPMFNEGLFKWIVFLPSVHNDVKPVPTRYYGVRDSGELKLRGIEARQKSACKLVKILQKEAVAILAQACSREEFLSHVPYLCSLLRGSIRAIPRVEDDLLVCSVTLSKLNYQVNNYQAKLVRQLQHRKLLPGMTLYFIHSHGGPVPVERYRGIPDKEKYTDLLIRSLAVLLQPFLSRQELESQLYSYGQTSLLAFAPQEEFTVEFSDVDTIF